MNQELNKSIESLILGKPKEQAYSSRELKYIMQYDRCEDEGLDEYAIFKQIWDEEERNSKIKRDLGYYGGRVLITHAGAGKAPITAPNGANLVIFNDDYFCHEITKALVSGRRGASTTFEFGTIAEYFFLNAKGVMPEFDAIICHPPRHCKMAELDYDQALSDIAHEDARVYYAVRSYEFLDRNGTLYVIADSKDAYSIHTKVVKHLALLHEENFDFDVVTEDDGSSILRYRKA